MMSGEDLEGLERRDGDGARDVERGAMHGVGVAGAGAEWVLQ